RSARAVAAASLRTATVPPLPRAHPRPCRSPTRRHTSTDSDASGLQKIESFCATDAGVVCRRAVVQARGQKRKSEHERKPAGKNVRVRGDLRRRRAADAFLLGRYV